MSATGIWRDLQKADSKIEIYNTGDRKNYGYIQEVRYNYEKTLDLNTRGFTTEKFF
jgi:hypothetical protein